MPIGRDKSAREDVVGEKPGCDEEEDFAELHGSRPSRRWAIEL